MSDDSDERLAARAAAGDEAAFERLVVRHGDRLRAWVRLRGGPGSPRDSCSDVVQSVFVRLHDKIAGFEDRGPGSFRNWMLTYARNVLRNHRRVEHAGKRDPEREELASVSRIYQGVHTPSHVLGVQEEVERFEQAFGGLDEEDREIILLARVEGLPHAEIAARLGKSEPACRKALSRALTRLAARLP